MRRNGKMPHRLGGLLIQLKEGGHRIVFSGGIGGPMAAAATSALVKWIGPYWSYFDAVYAASGSTLPLAQMTTGKTWEEMDRLLRNTRMTDYVDSKVLIAQYNENIFWAIWHFYADALFKFRKVMQHFQESTGLISGDKLRAYTRASLSSDDFVSTSPPLHILATEFSNKNSPYVFSADTTPDVPISDALVASCAVASIFAEQTIGDRVFVDADESEPFPCRSILADHIARGGDPSKLTIIGAMISKDLAAPPAPHGLFEKFAHCYSTNIADRVECHIEQVRARGTRVYLFTPNVDRAEIRDEHPFELSLRTFMRATNTGRIRKHIPTEAIGRALQGLRTLFATITFQRKVERFLRETTSFIYRSVNIEHYPEYFRTCEEQIGPWLDQIHGDPHRTFVYRK